jgi:hypothetical protein
MPKMLSTRASVIHVAFLVAWRQIPRADVSKEAGKGTVTFCDLASEVTSQHLTFTTVNSPSKSTDKECGAKLSIEEVSHSHWKKNKWNGRHLGKPF